MTKFRANLLEQIETAFNKIYQFTDRMGDEALNILDYHVSKYNLDDEYTICLEAQIDEYDPINLSDTNLKGLLRAHLEALADLRCE
jgi:hypothetical protein